MTARTIAERVNLERMRANAIEAAEQCNLVFVPDVLEPEPLAKVIGGWDGSRRLIFCDETARAAKSAALLAGVAPPAAVLVGPEGGFTDEERAMLRAQPFVTRQFRLDLASCGLIRWRLPPLPWCRRRWAIGAMARTA